LRRRRTDRSDTGLRRRHDDGARRAWPVDLALAGPSPAGDPWVGIVRQALDLLRDGDPLDAAAAWSDDVVWRVAGDGPVSGDHEGLAGILDYHGALLRLSGGTFRQRLLVLEGSRGPVVSAHVRTWAERADDRLDIPSLLVFELGQLRIHRVTELPGDQARWDQFWRTESD
jgi:ketosteroid isomerase-like protein